MRVLVAIVVGGLLGIVGGFVFLAWVMGKEMHGSWDRDL